MKSRPEDVIRVGSSVANGLCFSVTPKELSEVEVEAFKFLCHGLADAEKAERDPRTALDVIILRTRVFLMQAEQLREKNTKALN